MSTFRDRVSDAISAHPDAVVLSFACIVLFLVTANFLWARRAARLEKAIEELTASRDSLKRLLYRPEPAPAERDRPERASDRYSISERAPWSKRKAVVRAGARTDPEIDAAKAEPASATEAPEVIESERAWETTEAVEGDTTVRLARAEIPATWRAAEEDVTPAAAAWAAAPEAEGKAPAPSPYETMSFEPLTREEAARASVNGGIPFEPAVTAEKAGAPAEKADAASWFRAPERYVAPRTPAFSFTRPTEALADPDAAVDTNLGARAAETEADWAKPEPAADASPKTSDDEPAHDTAPERLEPPRLARDPEPLPLPSRTPGTPTPLKVAYDAWGSLNAGPAEAASIAADLADDPAYVAWGDVLAGNGRASRNAEPPAAPVPPPPAEPVRAGASGNGRVHRNGNGRDNGANGADVQLTELTAVAAQTERTPAADVDAPAPAGNNGGILLVEDDDNVAKIYRIVLESKGHTVRHAGDGVAALEEVRKGRPDLVLLDVMMPRMNGILFLQSLRAQTDMRDVPVVILSNFREPRLVDRAKSLGAIEYIVKAQTRPEALLNALPCWLAGEPAFAE